MRRVLIVAYYFPPIGAAGSFRMAGFVRHLPEFGWEPTVIASAGGGHPVDESLEVAAARVIRAQTLEPSARWRGSPQPSGRADPRSPDRQPAARRIARNVWRAAAFPDPQVGWYPAAARAALRTARRERFDAVFSSSFPITAHLVAWTVSARMKLPWVAEFRDPWSDWIPRFPHRASARRLEQAIARRAARVVAPSVPLAERLGARWGITADAIGHGADGQPVARLPQDAPNPAVLSYVGSYYPQLHGSLAVVWEALAELRAERAISPVIRWVGELPPVIAEEVAAHGLDDLLEVTGRVSQRQALELLRSSSMVFACGLRSSDTFARAASPSKLVEYLVSGLPVLYIDDPAGDAARMLEGHPGCEVAAFDDRAHVRVALEAGLAGQVHDRDHAPFTRRARAMELARILDDACAG